ncbi:MAG: hypothetical protein V1908_01420, partial [Candidatus Peregrinibacteria bacterium]
PPQIGKFRIALTMAMILQCLKGFCRACKTCKLIPTGAHPDTTLLTDNGESLKIDDIRTLIEKANLTAQGERRIFVIENIERMPMEAQNSFLKTLEEPPGRTMFLMTTSRIGDVLPTIQSRVRSHSLFNVDSETLKAYLKKEFSGNPDLDEIVNMAQGRPGLAISLTQDPAKLQGQRELYRKIESFLGKNNLAGKFLFVEELVDEASESAERLDWFFDAFTRYLRKLTLEYLEQEYHPLKSRFNLGDLVALFESLEKTRYLIDRNANKKLALENFFIATEKES